MKVLKDLTREQAIQIAKLIYDFDKGIKSDFDFTYQPYDETWLDDAREYIQVKFNGIVFADKVYPLILEINPSLDCDLYYLEDDPKGFKCMKLIGCRNQNQIQKLFIKWGINGTKNDRYSLKLRV